MSKGIVLSVLASSLFGVMYYFTSLLWPLSGAEIFGWRMLLTLPCMTLFMCFSGDWRLIPAIFSRLRQQPRFAAVLVALLLGESISAGQWLTYLPIWLAVLVLIFEGFKHLVRQRRSV